MRMLMLALAAALVLPAAAKADRETEAWISAGLSYNAHDRLRLSLEPQLRIRDQTPRAGEFLVDAGGRVELQRWLYFAFAYRFALRQTEDPSPEWQELHRVQGDIRVRLRAGRVQVRSRTRFQTRIRPEQDGRRFRHTLRQRFMLRIRAPKRFRPFFSTETFLRIRDRNGTEFWKQRFTLGSAYRMGDHELSLAYRLEIPIAPSNDLTSHIILIGYAFEI